MDVAKVVLNGLSQSGVGGTKDGNKNGCRLLRGIRWELDVSLSIITIVKDANCTKG